MYSGTLWFESRFSFLHLGFSSGHLPSLSQHGYVEKICSHMSWKPDLETLASESIQEICESYKQDEIEPIQWFSNFELFIFFFSAQVLKSSDILVKDMKGRSPFMDRYSFWFQAKLD